MKKFQPFDADVGDDSFPLAPLAGADAGAPNSVNSANKPVATIATLANYLINGFWQYNNTFAHHWGTSTITYDISGLNANEQMLAQSALNAWHEVANLTFVQTAGAANITFTHNGTMTAYEYDYYSGSGIISSAFVNISADWITNDGGAYDGRTGIDSYGYQTYIHEIGHALGLGHQGPYNGSATYSTNATYADDTWQYSVMSYFAQNNYGGSYRYVVTPQMADIYAVNAIYGAATTRTGDTVYGFHNTAGSIFNFSNYTQAPALTIYDSGGNDTLDCSGYSTAQTIDLHAGAFTSVGGLVNNIGIALNATIENAIGGSGNDTLIANDLGCTLTGGAGNDTLLGGAGADLLIGGIGVDTLTGGGGVDAFVFAVGDSSAASGQHDRITDFVSGVDHIDLSGIDAISTTSAYDLFRFIGTSAFDGTAGELDYFYNSSLGVTVLQGDTNGDRIVDFSIDFSGNIALSASSVIQTPPIVIESFGSTSLFMVGSNFYLNSSSGPELKYGGVPTVATSQTGVWSPIATEQTATGYIVAWKVNGVDQYTIWNTDNSGNYVSNVIGAVSGTNSTLESLETSFHQDLNGDGVIGVPSLPATVIESLGSTSLLTVGSNFYLNSSSGPTLKYGGTPVVATSQAGNWSAIGAEQTATGYIVAWKVNGVDQYTVWNTDNSGNYVSNVIGAVSGTNSTLESLETSFHQDLNGDGVIGVPSLPATVIESLGSTSLLTVGSNFYLNSSSGPTLKYGGTPVVATSQAGNWSAIGAEQTATGYIVAWKVNGVDQYTVWNTDNSGNYVSNVIGAVSGTNSTLESLETSFHQDLNGDGVIGVPSLPATVIESLGSTSLLTVGSNFHLNSSSGPTLKYGGTPVVATSQAGNWSAIGAEQTATGYIVAWKVNGVDQYTVWNTDNSGNYVSNVIGAVSGTNSTLESLETSFHQDLNSDGIIGVHNTLADVQINAAEPTTPTATSSTSTNDVLFGGAGGDAFIFSPNFGQDITKNFQPNDNTIRVDHTVFVKVAAIDHTSDSSFGDAVIAANAHDKITIIGVTTDTFLHHLNDFIIN
ncbi:M10 family metallopeptidase C-terminal domain-containing protein [Bradyrhizobium sediminis]|uniref:M10 family metallopeptidase C-terminal domain-containing protein n=1 Tax=Bradyrhizobium sediminis TaxID=2840469 RepID=A0A975RZ53_9BRAD|nr:M10 family metallopeptidase C-terminal domain-containing protein [Bradyrhizobium sediminis]QWG25109.1 M10 family metallopeptidase C-terminal domain-containing protein [Bradyrhizobium sediminis]